jgi:hypothetical protein
MEYFHTCVVSVFRSGVNEESALRVLRAVEW